jgi:hypothetical protein
VVGLTVISNDCPVNVREQFGDKPVVVIEFNVIVTVPALKALVFTV